MILLGVDTSTRWASVGLQVDSDEITERVWRSDQNHGRELMPAVFDLLNAAGLSPEDITHLAVALGPGGFSALRVGLTTVIGLAMPRSLPVAGVPTHAIEAEPYLSRLTQDVALYSILPAGRNELSWAKFTPPDASLAESGLCPVTEFVGLISANDYVCGEAAEQLAGKVPPERIIGSRPPTRKPASLITLAQCRFESVGPTSPTALRPIYARPPNISNPSAGR